MTDADLLRVKTLLRHAAEDARKEAAALEAYGRAKFGPAAEVIPLRPGLRRN